jgi:hypothetical protein
MRVIRRFGGNCHFNGGKHCGRVEVKVQSHEASAASKASWEKLLGENSVFMWLVRIG